MAATENKHHDLMLPYESLRLYVELVTVISLPAVRTGCTHCVKVGGAHTPGICRGISVIYIEH